MFYNQTKDPKTAKEMLKAFFASRNPNPITIANHSFYEISNIIFDLYGKRFSPSTLERKFRLLIEGREIEVQKIHPEGKRFYHYKILKIN